MKFLLCFFVVCVFLAGCDSGGGGGSDDIVYIDQPVTVFDEVYRIVDSDFIRYTGGEMFEYDINADMQLSDGTEDDLSGTMTVTLNSDFHNSALPQELIECVTESYLDDDNTMSSQSVSYFFYDDLANYKKYMTGNDKYYSNQDNPIAGSLVTPHVITVGDSWINESEVYLVFGMSFIGNSTHNVVDKEIIEVPLGHIETYKINSVGTYYFTDNTLTTVLTVTQTDWVHPKIGEVKSIEALEFRHVNDSELMAMDSITELSSVNWDIDWSLDF